MAEATSTLRSEERTNEVGVFQGGGSGHAARRHGVVQRGVCPIALSHFVFFFRNKGGEMGNSKNVKFRANSESFAEYGHQLCKHVAGRGNTFIPNFPSQSAWGKVIKWPSQTWPSITPP